MKPDHKHRVRRLLFWRRVKTCQLCGWRGTGFNRHLAESHGTPLVRLGQGDYERRIG